MVSVHQIPHKESETPHVSVTVVASRTAPPGPASRGRQTHVDVEALLQVLDGQHEGLVPHRVQVLVDHPALVEGLPLQLELHIRVAGPWRKNKQHIISI